MDHPINEWPCVEQCSAEHVGTLGHVLVERALELKRFVWPQIVDCSAPKTSWRKWRSNASHECLLGYSMFYEGDLRLLKFHFFSRTQEALCSRGNRRR